MNLAEAANKYMNEDDSGDLNYEFDKWTGQSAEWVVDAWKVKGDLKDGIWVFDPEEDDNTYVVTHRTFNKDTDEYEFDDLFQGTAAEVIKFVKNMDK